jgi:hypothetical protein
MAEIDRNQMMATMACETNAPTPISVKPKCVSPGWGDMLSGVPQLTKRVLRRGCYGEEVVVVGTLFCKLTSFVAKANPHVLLVFITWLRMGNELKS